MSMVVIEVNACTDRLPKGIIVLKMIEALQSRFQDTPEPLHRGVIKTASNAGHTLVYASPFHNFLEGAAGVLDTQAVVKQRLCVRIFLKSLLESIQKQRSIITTAQGKRNNIPSVTNPTRRSGTPCRLEVAGPHTVLV